MTNELSGLTGPDGLSLPSHRELSIRVFVKDDGVFAFGIFAVIAVATWSVAQDRSAVVPEMTVLLDNDCVRVQHHDVAVGQTIPMHSHPKYVVYTLKPFEARITLHDGSRRIASGKPVRHIGTKPSLFLSRTWAALKSTTSSSSSRTLGLPMIRKTGVAMNSWGHRWISVLDGQGYVREEATTYVGRPFS